LVNVTADAILNKQTSVRMQGRIFALQTLAVGLVAVLPPLTSGLLTELLDVCAVFGLTSVLPIFALTWVRWVSLDPNELWCRGRARR
jgi:hypothetical protein